jgi:hypothetical protein
VKKIAHLSQSEKRFRYPETRQNRKLTDKCIKQSPGGSIITYNNKGGELFGLHFGSLASDEDGVIARMKAAEAFFIDQNQTIGLWIDFYHTKLTSRVIGEFVETLKHVNKQILKLGLVGCSFVDRWRRRRLIKKTECLSS